MRDAESTRVTVVTAPACHLCKDAQARLTELRGRYPLTVRLVSATSSDGQALLRAHGTGMLPLVLIDGAFFCAGRLPRRKLERVLGRTAAAGAR